MSLTSSSCLLLTLLLGLLVIKGHCSIEFRHTGQTTPLNNTIIVGNGSDVIVDITCFNNDTNTVYDWQFVNGSSVPDPLMAFGISQDPVAGILRIYPASLIMQDGLNMFVCANNGTMDNITLTLFESLFFIEPIPSSLPVMDMPPLDCLTPVIPFANVSFESTSTNSSCLVTSDRGSFNRLVPILEPVIVNRQFIINPFNTTVANGNSAAFACIVDPVQSDSYSLINITWMFENVTDNSESFIITDDVINDINGTSILQINMVDVIDEGLYYCIAYYSDGINITSNMAMLEINDMTINNFLVPPPSSFITTEGNTVTLPCITIDNNITWSYQGTGVFNNSDFGMVMITNNTISIINIGRTAQGVLICTNNNNGINTTTNITVLAPLQFDSTPFNETIVTIGNNFTINCVANGNPAPYQIIWLRNNTILSSSDRILITESSLSLFNAQPNDTAIYQCVAMTARERINAYTYLVIEFIENVQASPDILLVNPVIPDDFTLTCSVLAQPLIMIDWFSDNITVPLLSRQLPVGFRGPSVSELMLNSGDLSGRNVISCTAQLNQKIVTESIIVNAFSPVIITMQPEDTPPVIVGYTVSFLCQAQSIPAPIIEWFRSVTGAVSQVIANDDNITITTNVINNNTTTSNITITVQNETDLGQQYYCNANNGMFINTSNEALLTRGETPSITVQPIPVIMIQDDTSSFNCAAQGIPLPNISWIVDPFVSVDPLSNQNGGNVESMINITASTNNTNIQCQATNIFANILSGTVLIIIAGPPLTPNIVNIVEGSRTATVTWDTPFSLIQITSYIVTLYNTDRNVPIASFIVPTTMIPINQTHLIPFTNYRVGVVAINRAGSSQQGRLSFETEQAAPDAPPTNLSASALSLGQIMLSWSPPNINQQNGIIQFYGIRYRDVDMETSEISLTINGTQTTLNNLTAGITYNISIFAITVSEGPSANIIQTTIVAPPDIVNILPSVSFTNSINSFPITIPLFSFTDADFLWIVVIQTDPDFNTNISPDTLYSTNASFVFASEYSLGNIPVNTPYVAAEISVTNPNIVYPYSFLIGDEVLTNQINDNSIYSNPPLLPGTTYTAFIRVFPPAPPEGIITKRQTSAPTRQYTVFTSTRFVPVVRTASVPSLSGGEVAGIVISILLLVTVLIIVGAVLVFLWRSTHYYKHTIPPPSRKGSVRLTESQKLLDSPCPPRPKSGVRHNKGSEIVTIVRNPHASRSEPLSPLIPSDERVPIARSNFSDYVRTLHANSDHLFAEEYELIGIKSPSLSHQASQLPCNQAKNRYANINSYDKSRVLLNKISGVEGSDYVNANYIAGYKDEIYIAGQGALPETTQDFWRMVWEQDSCRIIMLTNTIEKGRTKCHQYWPSSGSISFNDFTITMVDQQILAYYTIRTFILNMGNDRREVKQFHYTSWPDFGVPDHPNPIIGFIRRVNNSARKSDGPDIIHCSAGVGRTGTYITIQSMIQMIEEEDRLDVFNFVLGMRHERNLMVQTEAQYIFIHDTIVELLKVGYTEMSIQRLQKEIKILTDISSEDEICQLEQQFDKLNSFDVPDPSNYVSAVLPINKEKNRYPDVLPYEPYRVRLLMQPGVFGSDYINASYIDGYLRRNQFILTQGPLQNTVNDFWRMIWEHRVSTIVMLCSIEERGKEQSARYWPSDKITQYGDLFVEKVKEQDSGFYCVRELQMTHTKQNNDVRSLKQFHYTEWPEEKCPNSSTSLLDMISLVQKAHHLYGGGPVVVHDSSSIGRAGTFCIMNIVIERLKVEGMVDIFFSIHSLRRKHPGIVTTYDQYLFCFNTVREYLDSFDKYSNFD